MASGLITYDKLPLGSPGRPITAADLDRVQQRIATMAAKIPGPAVPNVVTVAGDYQVDGTEDVIHVDAQTGPVRITLLAPSSANRPLTIKQVNLQNGKSVVNPVTVVTRDGSNTIAGASSYALDDSGTGSVSFTADDQQHWPNAGAGGNPPAPSPGSLVYIGIPPIYVSGNVISYKATPTPAPTPPSVTPWVAPVSFTGLFGDNGTGVETWCAEAEIDFTGAPSLVTLYWWFQALSTVSGGVFNVRVGGSAYRALDGAIAATWSETNSTMTSRSVPQMFTPPVGTQRVTVTAKAPAAGQKAQIQGVNLIFR